MVVNKKNKEKNPKLFVSYCWTNSDHEQWVLNLSTELRDSGVDVILDKWDLKEGNDSYAFMEKMVSDGSIKKVLIISDREYTEKANTRKGGVGTESTIISPEVYENQDQNKFVAIACENDNKGKPYLPIFYKSRIHIDMTDASLYSEKFEQIMRWIFNKPIDLKPEIGIVPAYIQEADGISMPTSAQAKRVIHALREGKSSAEGDLRNYSNTFSQSLEKFRMPGFESKSDGEFDNEVIKNIEQFIPFRNEFLNVFDSICMYSPSKENIDFIHNCVESILNYLEPPIDVQNYTDWDFDNFIFIAHELFLYLVTLLVKNKRFQLLDQFLNKMYFIERNSHFGYNPLVDYTYMNKSVKSLTSRNARLNLGRSSLQADLIKERVVGTGIKFEQLMQSDFILFFRRYFTKIEHISSWWPITIVHRSRSYSPFEIFIRAQSKEYFEKIKVVIAVNHLDEITPIIDKLNKGEIQLPRIGLFSMNVSSLIGYDKLASIG